MRIEILGQLRVVSDDGKDLTPRGHQQRRAVAALALSGASGISIAMLEDLLWPHGAPSANALQATISKLRKLLAPASIVGDGRTYSLAGAECDLDDFERSLAAERWADVERLGTGDVLAALDGAGIAEPVRARVAAAVRRARARRLEAVVEGPNPDDATAELEALVVEEPLDEGWWSRLMIAHHRAGRRAAALDAYQRARSVLAEQSGLEPGPELRRAEARVLAGDEDATPVDRGDASPPTVTTTSRQVTVPARIASFIGRERELADLEHASSRHRLVTVIGPGGAGKTTLTLEWCRRREDEVVAALLADADADDRDSVHRTVARAIGLAETDPVVLVAQGDASDARDRIVEALVARSVVLVLDNCEHVVEIAAELAQSVAAACPHVRIVATSRESLGVPGEHLVPLPPLPAADALALFRERAHDHGIDLADADDELAAAICERLDGLPLAIELAAARVRTMTPAELLAGLADRFDVLSKGARFAEPRQRTLRAVVDWSHDLLEPAERVVFRRLAAFAGGASPDGLRAVCAGASPEGVTVAPEEVMDLVERLVDKSLVRSEHTGAGARFSMLQTLVDYAAEHLSRSGEREATLVRHAQFVADRLRGARHGLIGHDQTAWFATVARERSNIEGALGTAVAIGDAQLALDIVVPIGWYFFMAGEVEHGAIALESALACEGPVEAVDRALALALSAWLLANGPQVEAAVATAAQAWAMVDQFDDPWATGLILNIYAMGLFFSGNLEAVARMLPRLDEVAAASEDRWIRAMTGVVKGEFLQFRGDVDAARTLFESAASDFDAEGDGFAYALAITEGSELFEQIGDYDTAAAMLRRGIELADEIGFSGHPLAMRARLGNVETLRGDLDAAERCHREIIDDARAEGVPWLHSMAQLGLSAVERRRGNYEEAERLLEAAWNLPRSRAVPYMRSLVQVARGYLADQQGDFEAAFGHQAASLGTSIQLSAPRGVAYSLEGVAGALALSGTPDHHELAARLLGCAHALRVDTGGAMPDAERFDVGRADGRLRSLLGDAAFELQFEAGTTSSAVDLARQVEAIEPHVRPT